LADGCAAVVGAHRFRHHDRVTLPHLITPLHQRARHGRQQQTTAWGLLGHDGAARSYPGHTRKADLHRLRHSKTRGYELSTRLLVEGSAGHPIVPLELRLRTAQEVSSTRVPLPQRGAFRSDEVLPSRRVLDGLGLSGPLVPVLDREADSLAPYRVWQANGRSFLIPGQRGSRTARGRGEEASLAEVAGRWRFRCCREVASQGHTAVQHVAEAEMVLDRPAGRHRRRGGRPVHERVPGPPLALWLVISRVCDATGRTLAVCTC
jgi:hypothetical protein